MWSENQEIIEQMKKGSSGELWGVRLEQSDHFPILSHFLRSVNSSGLLIDIGCGAGDVSRVWPGKYLGVDFDWIVEKVAKVCNPNADYLDLDCHSENIDRLPNCDVVLMNAFLDVSKEPSKVLNDILNLKKSNYVIVHRQRIKDDYENDTVDITQGYAGLPVYRSCMSFHNLNSIFRKHSVDNNVQVIHWQSDYYSFCMRTQ